MDRASIVGAYTHALCDGDETLARALIHSAQQRGMEPSQIYLSIFEPSMVQVGKLWEENAITVAQEHLATSITERLIGEMSPLFIQPNPDGRVIILGCIQGELHSLGIRIATDLLIHQGWRVLYLGANVPTAEWVAIAQRTRADAVGISVNIASHIPQARRAIAALRASCPEAQIMVGGAAFNSAPQLWQDVGATIFSPALPDAIAALNSAIRPTPSATQ